MKLSYSYYARAISGMWGGVIQNTVLHRLYSTDFTKLDRHYTASLVSGLPRSICFSTAYFISFIRGLNSHVDTSHYSNITPVMLVELQPSTWSYATAKEISTRLSKIIRFKKIKIGTLSSTRLIHKLHQFALSETLWTWMCAETFVWKKWVAQIHWECSWLSRTFIRRKRWLCCTPDVVTKTFWYHVRNQRLALIL